MVATGQLASISRQAMPCRFTRRRNQLSGNFVARTSGAFLNKPQTPASARRSSGGGIAIFCTCESRIERRGSVAQSGLAEQAPLNPGYDNYVPRRTANRPPHTSATQCCKNSCCKRN